MKCTDKGILIAKRLDDAELFTKRFGSFAKADYETLLFSIYLDMLEQSARDYDISLELGINSKDILTYIIFPLFFPASTLTFVPKKP